MTTLTRTISQLQTLTHLWHIQQQPFSGLHQTGRSASYKHRFTWVTTNKSLSQNYTNPEDQPTTTMDSPGSQPITFLLRTTPTQTISQLQTLTHLGHNQQQSFSGLHHHGRSASYKHRFTWVTTNNSPYQVHTDPDDQPTTNTDLPGSQPTTVLLQDNTNQDDQPTANVDSPGSQPTTALLRTTPTRTISQLQTLAHLCHNQQQTFSGLHKPGQSANYKHLLTLVKTNNSPS